MDAHIASFTSQSEPDHDNSSLQNPSTNPAEAGTTDETRDEDHETSSIEALNWSEVEEEELAAAQQATLVTSTTEPGKLPSETKINAKNDKDEENTTNNGSSTNDEGSVLSTMLLQSINSSVSDEDPQARKLTVIENWASEVTNAVERGEIELAEDFPDESGVTGDDEEGDTENKGVRKRKGKKSSSDIAYSMMSSNPESTVDPLSNAPVLDDGPIWNKGPRSYTFQENRRFNQKLTFCLLIAVVLAIGLGLGNLVAHQECEAEYKASQQSPVKDTDKISVHTVPTTTTPAPIIPDRSTDSSMMGSSLPKKQSISVVDSPIEQAVNEKNGQMKKQDAPPVYDNIENRRRRRDDPVIDPKYKVHAETVSNVVHTLDRLSREIDQFENTTRKLQGVLMIPDEEAKGTEAPASSSLFDEEIHREEDEDKNVNINEENLEEEEEDEETIIEELIDAIEQTPDYLEQKKGEKRFEELQELRKGKHSKLFSRDPEEPEYPGRRNDIEIMLKSIQQFKDFQRRFVKSERKRLREEGKYNKLSWRLPEEYTTEEKNALRVRYRANWQEFLKLIKTKVPDPVEMLFGVEEDEEERTYGDVFHYPFPDPDDDLTPEEYDAQFKMNLEELGLLKKKSQLSEAEMQNSLEEPIISDKEVPSDDVTELLKPDAINLQEVDDLIITESKEEHFKSIEQSSLPEDIRQTTEQDQLNNDIGKSSTTKIDESKVHKETPLKSENSQYTSPTDTNVLDGTTVEGERLSISGKIEREASVQYASITAKKPAKKFVYSESNNMKADKAQDQSRNFNDKNGKRDQKPMKEQKNKQSKQKVKNWGNEPHNSNANYNNNNPNVNNDANSVNGKMSGKGKKLRNLESNKVFENIKGKNFDKRRGAPPGSQQKFGTDTKYSDLKIDNHEKNPASKKFQTGSTKLSTDEAVGEHGDKSFANNGKHKTRHTQDWNNNDNQRTSFNGNEQNYKNKQINGHRHQDFRDIRDQKQPRQETQFEKRKPNKEWSGKYNNQENIDSFSKESQFGQQKTEFVKRHDNHNSNQNSGNYENGKRYKSWQSKEKVDRREKSR